MAEPTRSNAEPFALVSAWLAEATGSEPNDPNAMALATATPDGVPSLRMVLLKGIDYPNDRPGGFVFYTNRESRKGCELAGNPRASLLLHWKSLRRQIRIEGTVGPVSDTEADAYFRTRSRISRLGAWASAQSRPLAERAELERRLAEFESRYPDDAVPRPPYWIGYRLVPNRFEFWQDMPHRLHDRTIFVRCDGGWSTAKLNP
ncbi:MAG: pyridoxamine 5'-phosphate oxidase [Acetobacteraceae bacterium]|nr:pyridoxamine 5'-phosphate oxidase [Acetobacteraceae bacterium]